MQTSVDDVEWDEVAPLLEGDGNVEREDPAVAVLGTQAASVARAAWLLTNTYVLVATNVPYLQKAKQSDRFRRWAEIAHPDAKEDLATLFVSRCFAFLETGSTQTLVTSRYWFFLGRYRALRERILKTLRLDWFVELGAGAFAGISGEVVNAALVTLTRGSNDRSLWGIDVSKARPAKLKAQEIRTAERQFITQAVLLANPDARISVEDLAGGGHLLAEYAEALGGITTGDSARYRMCFWEVYADSPTWELQQTPPDYGAPYRGREHVVRWEEGSGALAAAAVHGATIAGRKAWGRAGVALRITGDLPATLYQGTLYENICSVVMPKSDALLPAIWAFCSSSEYATAVRRIDSKLIVTANTLAKVPFDVERWQKVADQAGPLPEPWSDDPTQWLFEGRPEVATAPLQVAVGRLVGYRWPEQGASGDLDAFADADGIVCLPSVAGEAPAADRVQQLLAAAFGEGWSPGKVKELLEQAGSKKKSFDDWLRDEFFKQHCSLFGNRPFVWHIWDGQRDGFSALVNYHRLDRKALEKLTYTYLGQDWVERQRAEVREEVAGAEARLSAAVALQRKLEAILEGEAPYDIYVRWKAKHEQSIGWEPDLNDGVRLNVRPFVEAGVLRAPFNIHWRKDRGKNPDGSERENDIHFTSADKLDARKRAGDA